MLGYYPRFLRIASVAIRRLSEPSGREATPVIAASGGLEAQKGSANATGADSLWRAVFTSAVCHLYCDRVERS
jgi:hypothetical protein